MSSTRLLHVILFHKILYTFLISPFETIILLLNTPPPFLPCVIISVEQTVMQVLEVVSYCVPNKSVVNYFDSVHRISKGYKLIL